MPLIALRCPSCGGEIQLENVREIGFCMYCGNKVVIQEALRKEVIIDESHKVESWIALGHNALKTKNYTDAEIYANKIIESHLKNPDAWYIKGCCATKEQIAIEHWNKALSYTDKDKPVWKLIIEALNDPKNHFQTRMRTVTVIRGKALGGSVRKFHITLNDEEKIALGNGESKSFIVEEGSYVLKGQIASYKIIVPLNVKKDMTVYVNLNKKDNKWDVITT